MNWLAPQKPAEVAESRLITAILDGHFPIGDSLPPERELAGQLGVTRPTLREALQRMARDGWVDIQHGRSTRVRDYWREGNLGVLSGIARFPQHAPDDFIPNLLTIRLLMAPTYFRQSAERDPRSTISLVQQSVAAAETPAALAQVDWRLHHQMTVLSGNPIFSLILNGFKGLYGQMALFYFELEEARDHSRSFYRDLLSATEGDDPTLVEELTRKTMTESCALWRQATGGRSFSTLETSNGPTAFALRDEMVRERDSQ
jgi:GntR family negative regulator for fad regulon and positive regulator of fabA